MAVLYAKGRAHYFEILLGMEADTSELLNEMIASVKNLGRCGVTNIYELWENSTSSDLLCQPYTNLT